MMMPKDESSKINIDDYGSTRLLHDIEEISKALYFPPRIQTPQKPNENLIPNHKKTSIWKWKPLKALTHIRNHKLTSSFFLHVHSIEGLPLNLNDLSLCVYWKRKQDVLRTRSIRIKEGVAVFEETLNHKCSVYIGKNDHDNVAKYEPKLSLLYVSIVGAPSLDLGKHWIDLTRLLPLTLMELEDEKNRNGKWKTSFKLTGKAKGGVINVSFGFSLSGNLDKESKNLGKIPFKENGNLGMILDKGNSGRLQRVKSIPSNSRRRTHASSLSFNIKSGPSISLLYELLDDPKRTSFNEEHSVEFTVIDKGVEFAKKDQDFVNFDESSCVETINVADLFMGDQENLDDNHDQENLDDNLDQENLDDNLDQENLDDNLDQENLDEHHDDNLDENLEELEVFLQNLSTETQELDFSFRKDPVLEEDSRSEMVRSRSLDDLTKTVINDFMNFLGSDSEPDSPRERLLRQFEKATETITKQNFNFGLNIKENEKDNSHVFNSSFQFQEPNEKLGQSLVTRRKAKMLENLETEALMEEFGFNERDFKNSPRTSSGAFGSPVYCSPEKPPEMPEIGRGLGSFLKMGNGGFLRSLSPLVFKKAKNGERLIVQVSSVVVLPLGMGNNGVEIMRKWAEVGCEKMVLQGENLMPMEDITGKRLQELEVDGVERKSELPNETDSEHISVDNIAPFAIEKIQHLLLEGLRIQSGTPTDDPPSTISIPKTTTNIQDIINTSIPLETHEGYFRNFTLASRVLLRDPFRDYEPVGVPMICLIQVEEDFKITEVYLSGLKADVRKIRSGTRWLNSSGMVGKTKNRSVSKSNALVKTNIRAMNVTREETLWSVSSYVNGGVLSGLNLYVRNPDIVFK